MHFGLCCFWLSGMHTHHPIEPHLAKSSSIACCSLLSSITLHALEYEEQCAMVGPKELSLDIRAKPKSSEAHEFFSFQSCFVLTRCLLPLSVLDNSLSLLSLFSLMVTVLLPPGYECSPFPFSSYWASFFLPVRIVTFTLFSVCSPLCFIS